MHIPAIAHEFGFEIDADTFDRMHRGAHYLLNIRPSGDWPAQYFYYAGGVPRVMEEIKSMLHLDVLTVTSKTLGENLEELKKNGFFEHCDEILKEKAKQIGKTIDREDIIHSFDNAKGTDGRFSGASRGPVIGHVCPEAAAGGPIALVEEGDVIELDVAGRSIAITGVKGEKKTPEEMEEILAQRKANWKGFESKYKKGLLKLYAQHAVSSMKGAYIE